MRHVLAWPGLSASLLLLISTFCIASAATVANAQLVTGDDPEGQMPPPPPPPPPVNRPPPGHLPCNWAGDSGGQGTTRNKHYLGSKPGAVTIHYNLFTIPDDITVFYRGNAIVSTRGPTRGTGQLAFNWRPIAGDYAVVVVVTGPLAGTTWRYAMACPS